MEKRYSNLCLDVLEVIASNGCPKLFTTDQLGWNKTREDAFEEKILKYMQEKRLLSETIKTTS